MPLPCKHEAENYGAVSGGARIGILEVRELQLVRHRERGAEVARERRRRRERLNFKHTAPPLRCRRRAAAAAIYCVPLPHCRGPRKSARDRASADPSPNARRPPASVLPPWMLRVSTPPPRRLAAMSSLPLPHHSLPCHRFFFFFFFAFSPHVSDSRRLIPPRSR